MGTLAAASASAPSTSSASGDGGGSTGGTGGRAAGSCMLSVEEASETVHRSVLWLFGQPPG